MAWSTREIAELAGTSLRTVRHYHDVGLLPEPERRSNGYKQYGVAHLVRLLRITRLVGLGFSLPQIAELGDHDEHPEQALRALDTDLNAQIERLQRLRAEVAEILEHGVPTDLPTEFAVVRRTPMSDADRGLVAVMGRLLGEGERAAFAEVLADDARTQSHQDFDDLAPDADDAARQELAERMAADLWDRRDRFPDMTNLGTEAPVGPQRYRKTVDAAMTEVYSPAQRDALGRMLALIRERLTDPS